MNPISYEQWTSASNSLQFIIASIILFGVPFLIYIITGCFVKGKNSQGRSMTRPAITYLNWWYAPIIFTLIGIIIYLILIVFPIWILIFD
jgi:hypothetical protein